MEDPVAFAASFPELCLPADVRVPGLGVLPDLRASARLELTADALASFRVDVPKDPNALPNMLRQGPEAVAFYASFRLAGDRWGIHIRAPALRAVKEEFHRIVWRDLGKYADRDISDIVDRIEYSLVLDYLLAHNRVHFVIDRVAAAWEAQDRRSRYAPYQASSYSAPSKPVMNVEDIGNIEEALANLAAFRSYMNPAYGDGVARLVEGRLDPRNVEEWKAFFVGGRFAVEIANMLSRQPPGWKDFVKFLNRKTSVGSTNYVRIQYSYNPEALERGQRELSRRLAGEPVFSEATRNLFKEAPPDLPPVYLL